MLALVFCIILRAISGYCIFQFIPSPANTIFIVCLILWMSTLVKSYEKMSFKRKCFLNVCGQIGFSSAIIALCQTNYLTTIPTVAMTMATAMVTLELKR